MSGSNSRLHCEFCEGEFSYKEKGWEQVTVEKIQVKNVVYEKRPVFRCASCKQQGVSTTKYGAPIHIPSGVMMEE
jgi:predicted metal-binding protein